MGAKKGRQATALQEGFVFRRQATEEQAAARPPEAARDVRQQAEKGRTDITGFRQIEDNRRKSRLLHEPEQEMADPCQFDVVQGAVRRPHADSVDGARRAGALRLAGTWHESFL